MSLDKLSKLLNQAENASTKEEAEAFMEAAQKFSTLWSIDLAVARKHQASKVKSTPIIEKVIIGEPRQHGNKHKCEMMTDIALINDVKITLCMDGTSVNLFGYEEDVEVVKALYASLSYQMTRAANDAIAEKRHLEEETTTWSLTQDRWVTRPMSAKTFRLSFYVSFTQEVSKRLRAAKNAATKQAQEMSENGDSQALVLVEKRKLVDDFFTASTGKLRRWGGVSSNSYSQAGLTHGREAGKRARLGGEKAIANRTALA